MSNVDRTRSERGAITIHVAISLIALLMFAGMVIDQGPFYIARRQAQNAADAGALAGAIELMFFGTNAMATANAQTITSQHAIWGEATALADIQVSPLPFNCPDGVPSCIRVDVMRGQPDRAGGVHTNTFPTFLVRMFGPTAQGVRATATAQIAAGNSVQCIKPWVVADKWTDNSTGASGGLTSGAWDQMDTFDPAVDTYPALGFSAETDIGLQLMLKGEGHDYLIRLAPGSRSQWRQRRAQSIATRSKGVRSGFQRWGSTTAARPAPRIQPISITRRAA